MGIRKFRRTFLVYIHQRRRIPARNPRHSTALWRRFIQGFRGCAGEDLNFCTHKMGTIFLTFPVQVSRRKSATEFPLANILQYNSTCLPFPHNLLDKAEEDIVINRPLVRLVEHDNAILSQQWIQHHFPQQHTICAKFQLGLRAAPVRTIRRTVPTVVWV